MTRDPRKKSIYLQKDVYPKVRRRRNLSGYLNDLIRQDYEMSSKSSDDNRQEIDELISENERLKKEIQSLERFKKWSIELLDERNDSRYIDLDIVHCFLDRIGEVTENVSSK